MATDDVMRSDEDKAVETLLRHFLGECESAIMYGYTEVPQEVFDRYVAKLRPAGDRQETLGTARRSRRH